jgi:hypothetical protein
VQGKQTKITHFSRYSPYPASTPCKHPKNKFVAGTGVLRQHDGGLVRFLVRPEQTATNWPSWRSKPGGGVQPPPHTHQQEDETFLISEGELFFHDWRPDLHGHAGRRGIRAARHPARYQIRSEWARFTMIITPGQFANYFWELTEDAPTGEMPPLPQGPPPAEEMPGGSSFRPRTASCTSTPFTTLFLAFA